MSTTTTISTGSHDYELSSVNVGWISSTIRKYTGNTCKIRAYSNGVTLDFDVVQADGSTPIQGYQPFYQWGRKDPELPSTGTGNTNHAAYTMNGTFGFSYQNTNATIGTTIKNPGKHYYSSSTCGP